MRFAGRAREGRARAEVEVMLGGERVAIDARSPEAAIRRAVLDTLTAVGSGPGHVAVALVSSDEIRSLNREHRGLDEATDVLSFPVDGREPLAGPRELGDVVICPEHTADLLRATVHGVLHLMGHDHETDRGEMLALEERIVAGLR